ncbi:helix-turn-helix transcriptional regulator [Sphingomonas sp. MMS12-HWE2-04]|uniref:helix-turn-helix transcriptional regulator n=1 Tax=Sphingomonas sp. MMS12-HWE2-04 TaxID=3234199 RepID=UPI00384A7264
MTAYRPSPVDALTPAQLACVRLIRTKGSTKRIAAELGISPNTVSQHLKEARLRLGNVSRFDAAEIVAAHDAEVHPQQLTSGPQTLVCDAEWAMLVPPSPSVEAPTPARVNEEILSFRPGRIHQISGWRG